MSKSRDLANLATAGATVSATELGYVDGVTSAIQTQMDAKAPSSTIGGAGGAGLSNTGGGGGGMTGIAASGIVIVRYLA